MNQERVNIKFWIFFGLSLGLIVTLVVVYFIHFHGLLSNHISDWANFSDFIYGLSTVALTAVNVWLFYKLTSAANSINTQSQETSTKIVNAFTIEEKKRSRANAGVTLMQEYNDAHDKLMQQISVGGHKNVNFPTISVAACQLETAYQILHKAKEVFPSLQTYAHHNDYLEELRGIANQPNGHIEGRDLILPNANQLEFQRINAIQDQHRTVVSYYKEIMELIQTDLGAVYAN